MKKLEKLDIVRETKDSSWSPTFHHLYTIESKINEISDKINQLIDHLEEEKK